MCSYDFDHPDSSQTIEARAAAEQAHLEAAAKSIFDNIDSQQEIERMATDKLDEMVRAFLEHEWPEDSTTWVPVFVESARMSWPEATFRDLRAEVFMDGPTGCWCKRFSGEMDLNEQKIVGFKFDVGMKRNYGEAP
jgi:hypothetical protein